MCFKSNSICLYTQETDRPTVFDIPDKKGPAASNAASGKRSNAIKIVKVIIQIETYLELRTLTFCMVNISITGILSFLYSHPQIIKNQRSPEEIVEINKTVKKVGRSFFYSTACTYV